MLLVVLLSRRSFLSLHFPPNIQETLFSSHGPTSIMSSPSTATLSCSQIYYPELKNQAESASDSLHVVSIPPKARLTDSCATSLTEKGSHNGWKGYQQDVLPAKSLPKSLRNLRYIVLNIYRRLFTICFRVNMGILV